MKVVAWPGTHFLLSLPSHLWYLVHFLKSSCASAFVPGNAGLQPGSRSHAGAWRSQGNAQTLLWRCTRAHVRPHWTLYYCRSGITSAWTAGSLMDFYAILDQVIALRRQRQRVTYRALQRQFDLDEDALNDLKDALLYAHPQVVDDEGGGLCWTGDTVSTPVQAPPSTPPASQIETPGNSLLDRPKRGWACSGRRWWWWKKVVRIIGKRSCGSGRASVPLPARCSLRSMAGSPRGLTPPTCRKPGHC